MSDVDLKTNSKRQVISVLKDLIKELEFPTSKADSYTLRFVEHMDDGV